LMVIEVSICSGGMSDLAVEMEIVECKNALSASSTMVK
jgi:hypothetical protein